MIVADAAVIAQVGVLMGGGRPRARPRSGAEHGGLRSQPPGGDYPVRVHDLGRLSGLDGGVVEDR